MNNFQISEKTLTSLPNMNIAKAEVENIAQVFELRVLDYRRFTDAQASDWFTAILNKHGADHIFGALTRVRRLAGREIGFWLASICVVFPKLSPILKNPPDWTDDEVWRVAFKVFLNDEMRKTIQRIDAQIIDAAINEQV